MLLIVMGRRLTARAVLALSAAIRGITLIDRATEQRSLAHRQELGFPLHDQPTRDIVPPPEMNYAEPPRVRRRRPLGLWVRLALIAMALAWLCVFLVAWKLDPYRDGRVWLEETHRQLGLPPCTFKHYTGLPCPSCGMTSSFALLVRGDVWHALQANAVGAGLALFGMVMLPWCLVSAWRGRWLWIRKMEPVFIRLTVFFVVVLFGRWVIVLLAAWWNRS